MEHFDEWFAKFLAASFYAGLPILLAAPFWVQFATPKKTKHFLPAPQPSRAVAPIETSQPETNPNPSPKLQPNKPDAAQVGRGQQAFTLNCAPCHQAGGKGLPGFAPSIRNQDFLAIASDKFIRNTVQKGRLGTAMAPRPDITHAAMSDIIAWLRSLPVANPLVVVVDESVRFAGDAVAGGGKFARYCAACHGPRGEGYLAGVPGPGIGLAGFLNEACDDYIFQTVRHGRMGTPMKSFLGARGLANLNVADVHDIIAWLRSDKGVK